MTEYATIAAVDLGSNSFHLQVARIVGDQIYPLDSLRWPVRLGAGLTRDKRLDEPVQERALQCLKHFGERLRGVDRHAVRAVGTNTLRVAKNAGAFLKKAEAALGVPIEVVAGREEARLIYLGVSHELPASRRRLLVIDIGGGSTECIIGRGYRPQKMESLYMGCVSYSLRYFEGGKITKGAMKEAELAASNELETIVASHGLGNWDDAVGSSGTVRAIGEALALNGFAESGITPEGLERLRSALIKAGNVHDLDLKGLKPDRLPVLPGGLVILNAALSELKIGTLAVASGALRQGILYDMLGRIQHHDMRDATVEQFVQRYHVDVPQALRVARLALQLYGQLTVESGGADGEVPRHIEWAAKLHEIGISVAYSGYNRHSAYIIQNADMPGFSRMEQQRLALLVLAHRRSLKKIRDQLEGSVDWNAVISLRVSALIYRRRSDLALPDIAARSRVGGFRLKLDPGWLEHNPLTVAALREEIQAWDAIGVELEIKALDQIETAALGPES